MSNILLVIYVVIGVIVYIVTTEKVDALYRTISTHSPVVTYLRSAIFIFVVALWPIWFFIPKIDKEGPL